MSAEHPAACARHGSDYMTDDGVCLHCEAEIPDAEWGGVNERGERVASASACSVHGTRWSGFCEECVTNRSNSDSAAIGRRGT